jgi:hypothetical protein
VTGISDGYFLRPANDINGGFIANDRLKRPDNKVPRVRVRYDARRFKHITDHTSGIIKKEYSRGLDDRLLWECECLFRVHDR